MKKQRVIIMGAAGRDFHNFNVYFRDNPDYEVVAFTATQIPNIDGRRYPAALSGKLYPQGIPIHPSDELSSLIAKHHVDQVLFSYSDVSYQTVMHESALVNAAGADFRLMSPGKTMLKSSKPVVSICAVRTGCGKSQTTLRVMEILKENGKRPVAVRHPMPYGDLVKQKVQRYAQLSDMDLHKCTIEEREEYEQHITAGNVIYAGVDYEAILRQAEQEADVIVWDGGNNDTSFYKPDLAITVADPHRPGHERRYYPGEINLLMADVIVINKIDTAEPENVLVLRESIRELNPRATVIDAASPMFVEDPALIRQKTVLAVEDGPTLTHGGMTYGAAILAGRKHGVKTFIDPRPYAVDSIAATFQAYPEIGILLPAMGYGAQQIADLEATINAVPCDAVLIGTPIDLRRLVKLNKPATRVRYKVQEIGSPTLTDVLQPLLKG